MSDILLSICIPTFNRSEILIRTLESIVKQDLFANSNDVEIVISNNCSTDNTDETVQEFKKKYPDKIKYIKQDCPVEPDIHNFKVMEYASGKYCKINNDTCSFKEGSLNKIVEYLKANQNIDALFLHNKKPKSDNNKFSVDNFKDFLDIISRDITWIGSICIKHDTFCRIQDPLRYKDLKLPQVDIWAKLFEMGAFVNILEDSLFDVISPKQKGGNFNVSEVFGKNYLLILSNYIDTNDKLFKREKKKILPFINKLYFDFNKRFSYLKTGYFKNMLPIYKYECYFYISLILCLLKFLLSLVLITKKDEEYKTFIIFNCLRYKVKRKNK